MCPCGFMLLTPVQNVKSSSDSRANETTKKENQKILSRRQQHRYRATRKSCTISKSLNTSTRKNSSQQIQFLLGSMASNCLPIRLSLHHFRRNRQVRKRKRKTKNRNSNVWLTAQPTPIQTRFSNLCRSSVLKSSSRPQPRFTFIHPGPFISDCWANQPKTSANGSMPSAWDLERARLSKTTMTNFLHPHYLTRMTLMMTTGSHLRLPAQSQIDQAT